MSSIINPSFLQKLVFVSGKYDKALVSGLRAKMAQPCPDLITLRDRVREFCVIYRDINAKETSRRDIISRSNFVARQIYRFVAWLFKFKPLVTSEIKKYAGGSQGVGIKIGSPTLNGKLLNVYAIPQFINRNTNIPKIKITICDGNNIFSKLSVVRQFKVGEDVYLTDLTNKNLNHGQLLKSRLKFKVQDNSPFVLQIVNEIFLREKDVSMQLNYQDNPEDYSKEEMRSTNIESIIAANPILSGNGPILPDCWYS